MLVKFIMKIFEKFFKNNEKLNANEIVVYTDSTNGKYKTLDAYLDNINNYSTEEVVVGKWVDGKPIYRKVITYTGTISGNRVTNITHNISNLDLVINGNALCQYGAERVLTSLTSTSDSNSASQLGFRVADTAITAIGTNNYTTSTNWYFILEYTKTTD